MILALLLEIPQWHTVTLIEALWLLVGLLGLAYVGWNFLDVLNQMRDLIFVPGGTSGREKSAMAVAAWGHVRREAVRCLQMLGVVIVGITATFSAPPVVNGVHLPAYLTLTGLVLTVVLALICWLSVVQSYLDRHQRQEIEKLFRNGGGES